MVQAHRLTTHEQRTLDQNGILNLGNLLGKNPQQIDQKRRITQKTFSRLNESQLWLLDVI